MGYTRHEAYRLLHTRARAVMSEAEFTKALDVMDAIYGRPLVAELTDEASRPSDELGTQNVRKYTFALTTAKHPRGTDVAVVEVAADGTEVAVLSYQVMTSPGETTPY